MSSTIRVSAAAKRSLQALQKRWQKEGGRKVTQEEAAGRAFAILANDPELAQRTAPWTKKQRAVMKRFMSISDPAVSSQDIDEVLYGGKA